MVSLNTLLPCIRTNLLVLAILLQAMLAGCVSTDKGASGPPLAELGGNPQYTARLSCFLTLKDNQGPAIRMEITGIEVFGNDLWLPLASRPLKIDSAEIATGQLFLGGRAVLPGNYNKLRLTITKGELQNADDKNVIIQPEPLQVEMNFPAGLNLDAEDSPSIHIIWDVQKSLKADNTFDPILNVIQPGRQLPVNLVFVSCPDIDTIFIVRADKNWVVDSFGLKGRPTYLAIDQDSSNQRLYVLTSRDRMVKVIDLSIYRVVNFFPVPLNNKPTFMTISPDGQYAFLLDENSGYLSRMDLTTGQSMARFHIGYRPQFAAYLEKQNLLAVSLSLSQKVLLLDPESLSVLKTISVGSNPSGMVVSENQLFIAEAGDNTVSVHDLDTGENLGRIYVGFGPRHMLQTNDQVFVSNYLDGSLSSFSPVTGEFGVAQEISGLGRPAEMAFDQFFNRLYVADDDRAGLSVIDINSSRLLGYISLGARAFGLDVIQ